MAKRGLFFSFDGIDGTGKSTQARQFAQWLADLGYRVTTCRDPGTTQVGEQLRALVLDRHDVRLDARSETLIYMAARAQLVSEIIEPAMARGDMVVSDRYLLANVVYQGYGLDLPVGDLWRVGEFATRGLHPTCVFLLDLSPEEARRRLGVSNDRMEARDAQYFHKVRQGFLREAELKSSTIRVIDASREIDTIQESIRGIARKEYLGVS